MKMQQPTQLESWIGGYLGPSYKVALAEDGILYEVYERGYELHDSELIVPSAGAWTQFLRKLDLCGVWDWQERYQGPDAPDGTSWYVAVATANRSIVSRGINHYPPGFVDFMRALRHLLDGRNFA
jgi:hypothetical protein